jgi:hypothetical protein
LIIVQVHALISFLGSHRGDLHAILSWRRWQHQHQRPSERSTRSLTENALRHVLLQTFRLTISKATQPVFNSLRVALQFRQSFSSPIHNAYPVTCESIDRGGSGTVLSLRIGRSLRHPDILAMACHWLERSSDFGKPSLQPLAERKEEVAGVGDWWAGSLLTYHRTDQLCHAFDQSQSLSKHKSKTRSLGATFNCILQPRRSADRRISTGSLYLQN